MMEYWSVGIVGTTGALPSIPLFHYSIPPFCMEF